MDLLNRFFIRVAAFNLLLGIVSPASQAGELVIAPEVSFSRIDARDNENGGKSTLLSTPNYGGKLLLETFWSARTQFKLEARYRVVQWNDLPGRTLDGKRQTQMSFRGSWVQRPNRVISLIPSLGLFDEFVIRSNDSANVQLVRTRRMGAGLSMGIDYLRFKDSTYSMLIHSDFRLPGTSGSQKLATAYGGGVELSIKQFNESWMLDTSAYYAISVQNSSLVKSLKRDAGFFLGLGLRW